MVRTTSMLAAGLCSMLASPILAQAPAPAPAPAACEMHVWPAPEVKAITQGWVWNHTVDQAFDPAKGGVERPKVLAPEAQAALLGAMDLAGLFHAEPAQVVVHPEPLTRAQALSAARQSPSASPCYSELIVRQVFYDDAPMAGRSLRTLFAYRRFGDAPEVQSTFSTFGETSLVIFPAKTAAEAKAADAELQQAYRANVNVFALYEQSPHYPKKPKGK